MRFLRRLLSLTSTGDPVPAETKPAPWDGSSPYRLAAGVTPVPVRFVVVGVSVYQKGEVAGFAPVDADRLLDLGLAVGADEGPGAEDRARALRAALRAEAARNVSLLDRAADLFDRWTTLSPDEERLLREAENEERAAWLREQCLRHGGAYLPGVDD